ncbi:MAG: hypothetical protein WC058_14155, partial [Phycisphaeraceae bacterium]
MVYPGDTSGPRSRAGCIRRIGGIAIGCERLRQIVEQEAQAASEARDRGRVPAVWTARNAAVEKGGPTRIYTGVDGVMARTVTQAEKDKRRENQAIRRRKRDPLPGVGVGNRRPLPAPRPGADQAFKEMKIGVFYDQTKTHRHAFVTAGDHRRFEPPPRRHARQVEMLDDPAALARGWDIGSGPTEAMCKTLTLRLKRPGMKWDTDHAAPMMNL